MAKKRVQEKTTLGGMQRVIKFNIPYLLSVAKDIVLEKVVIRYREKPNQEIDYMEVYGKILVKHDDGTVIMTQTQDTPLFVLKDKGALVEYDKFTETLFNQVDIDNPAYIVDYVGRVIDPETDEVLEEGTVVRIYWVDGQIEDIDPETDLPIMVDNEVDIEPYQKKGKIDPATRTVIVEADEPLADVYANIGAYMQTLIKGKFTEMYA